MCPFDLFFFKKKGKRGRGILLVWNLESGIRPPFISGSVPNPANCNQPLNIHTKTPCLCKYYYVNSRSSLSLFLFMPPLPPSRPNAILILLHHISSSSCCRCGSWPS